MCEQRGYRATDRVTNEMHWAAPKVGCNNILKMGNLGMEIDVTWGDVSR